MATNPVVWHMLCLTRILVAYSLNTSETLSIWDPKDPASKNRDLVVWFDPYVSFKDSVQRPVYNETTLTPLLEKVGSRFSQIMVHITEEELKENSWNAIASETVAKLNKLKSSKLSSERNGFETTSPYLQVWISFHYTGTCLDNWTSFSSILSDLSDMCSKANQIHPGTVYALTIHNFYSENQESSLIRQTVEILHKKLAVLPQSQSFKLGMMLSVEECNLLLFGGGASLGISHRTPFLKWAAKYMNIIFFDAINQYGINNDAVNTQTTIRWLAAEAEKCRSTLKSVYGRRPYQMGVISAWTDTRNDGTVNMTNLVRFWEALAHLGGKMNVSFIIQKAFDTPYSPNHLEERKGWWRLKESSRYKDSTEYVFEEKVKLAAEEGKDDFEKINETWLKQPVSFVDVRQVGVSIPYFLPKLVGIDEKYFLRQASQQFRKLVISLDMLSNYEKGSTILQSLSEFKNESKIFSESGRKSEAVEVIIIVNGEIQEGNAKNNSMHAKTSLEIANLADVFLFKIEDENILQESFMHNIDENLKNGLYKSGPLLPLKSCFEIETFNVSLIISLNLHDVIAFEADVQWSRLVSSVEHYLPQFIILLEACQGRVENLMQNKESIIFLVNWKAISMEHKELYKLVSFVRFWEGLSSWAGKKDRVSVILGQAFDSISETGQVLKSEGWWTVSNKNKFSEGGENQLGPGHFFVDRKTEALRIYQEVLESRKLKNYSQDGLGVKEILLISFGISVFLGVISLMQFINWRSKYRYQIISKHEVDDFYKPKQSESNKPQSMGYNKHRYEIKKRNFLIDDQGELGNGEFGKVRRCRIFCGEGQSLQVAAKMPKFPPKHGALVSLLSEIKILSYVGKHESIIELVGAYTEELNRGIVFVFLELCHIGSLHKYLLNLKPTRSEEKVKETTSIVGIQLARQYENTKMSKKLDPELSNEFSEWAMQIGKGMEYLALHNIVHADLATRNILININRQAKISDFGLSRRMYNYQCYVKTGQEPLPWRWMAPESLRFSKFTEKTDVWSFGVLLWEIYSLGETPYPGTTWDANFVGLLENGLRLPKPIFNENDNMYSLMLHCWILGPARRPTFTDVLALLELSQPSKI